MLAAWISDHIRITGMQCAFFPFFHGSDKQKKCKSMFATLLWQILDGVSYETLEQVHSIVFSSGNLSIRTLVRALEHAMSTLTSIFYLVIDGVDESDDDWDETGGPFHTLKSWLTRFPKLRILLSGRCSVLQSILRSYPESGVELSDEVTKGDICKFITYKIQESAVLKSMPDSLKDHIRQTLEEKSNGMFLWVELVFKELRHCYTPNSIRNCLQDLPRELEAEYARLFLRLIDRLHGDPRRPTYQISVARTLLALIMGALESFTVDDLRHAYAASCCRGSMWREDLIPADAVLDLIGDFVAFDSSQKARFCHSSLEDLLFLPQEHWTGSLEKIKFFRLQYSECHELMAKACFEYITNFDFGYPLTDGSYYKLINEPFLLYTTKSGLSHMFYHDNKESDVSRSQIQSIKAYIASPHFGGLVEFVAIASLEDDGFVENYINNITFELDWAEVASAVERRIIAESQTRLSLFGSGHPVTQTWAQIQNAIITSLNVNGLGTLSHGLRSQLQDQNAIKDSKFAVSNSIRLIDAGNEVSLQLASALSSSRSRVVRGKENANPKVTEAFSSAMNSHARQILASHPLGKVLALWADPRAAFVEVAQRFVESLPIPIHIAYAITMVKDERLREALLVSARRRTEGKKTFCRAWILAVSGAVDNYEGDARIIYQSEAHDILRQLEDNPITRRMFIINIAGLIETLDALERVAEMPKLINDMWSRITNSGLNVGRHRRRRHFYSVIYMTDEWKDFEIRLLGEIAGRLHSWRLFEDAERVYGKVVCSAKAHYGHDDPETQHFLLHHIECLIRNSKFSKVEDYPIDRLRPELPKESIRSSGQWYYRRTLVTCKLVKLSQGPQVLLNDVEPREGKTRSDKTLEEIVIQERVIRLETTAEHGSLNPTQQNEQLMQRCLKLLAKTTVASINGVWLNDAVWKCCVLADQVFEREYDLAVSNKGGFPGDESKKEDGVWSESLPTGECKQGDERCLECPIGGTSSGWQKMENAVQNRAENGENKSENEKHKKINYGIWYKDRLII